MKIIISIITMGILFCSFSCESEADGINTRKLMPYDPKKAGAVIEEYFDLTDSLIFPGKPNNSPWVADVYNKKIASAYDMAEHNGCIYIHVNGKIFIYDKETFQLVEDIITIVLPDHGYSEDEYNELLIKKEPFYDPNNVYFYSMGIVITGNNALLLTHSGQFWVDKYYLFSVDLSTGNAILLDKEEKLELKPDQFRPGVAPMIGYSKSNNHVWFYNGHYFNFYNYDENTYVFTEQGNKIAAYKVGKENNCHYWWASMKNNSVWYSCFWNSGPPDNLGSIGLDKRSLDDPSNSLQYIDVQHLGTLSIPQSIAYDDPYIWIMVERDNQIQMLKLLPN